MCRLILFSSAIILAIYMKHINRIIIFHFFVYSLTIRGQGIINIGSPTVQENGSLYWGSTIVFAAINGTTTYFNIKKLHKSDKYRSNAVFGVLSGGLQTTIGLANLKSEYSNSVAPTFINIGIGVTTVVTSIIRLATKNPAKNNSVSVNLLYVPRLEHNSSIVGLTLTKQFD